ncbi:MAG: DUF1329 domain-containing protein [Syntrophobacteraceae bacterium]
MKLSKITLLVIVITCFSSLLFGRFALADVSPGDVIDKSNYQKIEGLVPDSIFNWVKNGDMVLNIGKLNYSPAEMNNILVGEKTLQENTEKYAVKDSLIVDAKTGGEPGFIKGIPFPQLDPKDPDLGLKYMYNRDYLRLCDGTVDVVGELLFITPNGFEREAKWYYYQYPFEGHPPTKDIPNPDRLIRYNMYVFREPYDVAGTSLMTWRYRKGSMDMNFAYVPSIRRVRRLTPANRSDAILGSDICWDDGFGFDGKPEAFDWKVLKTIQGLVPFTSEDPQTFEKDPELGGYMSPKNIKPVTYGYQKPEWKGAKWAPLNLVWVKRPVYVIEAKNKDPYYNFGTQMIWMDSETAHSAIRDMNDRSGAYWKTMICSSTAYLSEDKKTAINTLANMQAMDSRNKRCTIVEVSSPRNIWHYFTNSDATKFSLAGYAAFCK